jgi:hypothetical protein
MNIFLVNTMPGKNKQENVFSHPNISSYTFKKMQRITFLALNEHLFALYYNEIALRSASQNGEIFSYIVIVT